MTDDLIRTPADLRPGDIMFGPIGGLVGVGVGLGQLMLGEGFRVGTLSVRHVAIVTGVQTEGVRRTVVHMVEAMPSGARLVSVIMDGSDRWTPHHAYVRLPEDWPGQAEDAANIARLMVAEGVRYSFASYPALAAWRWGIKTPRLEKWIDRRGDVVRMPHWSNGVEGGHRGGRLPVEAICSVLVDQAWSLAGHRVMHGVARQAVTPGAMADQLLSRTGAIWCRPFHAPALVANSWQV